MRLMAEKSRVISEGAGALPLAAALTGKAGKGPDRAIVSGGNIDLAKPLKSADRLIGSVRLHMSRQPAIRRRADHQNAVDNRRLQ